MPHYTSASVRTNTRWKSVYDSIDQFSDHYHQWWCSGAFHVIPFAYGTKKKKKQVNTLE